MRFCFPVVAADRGAPRSQKFRDRVGGCRSTPCPPAQQPLPQQKTSSGSLPGAHHFQFSLCPGLINYVSTSNLPLHFLSLEDFVRNDGRIKARSPYPRPSPLVQSESCSIDALPAFANRVAGKNSSLGSMAFYNSTSQKSSNVAPARPSASCLIPSSVRRSARLLPPYRERHYVNMSRIKRGLIEIT